MVVLSTVAEKKFSTGGSTLVMNLIRYTVTEITEAIELFRVGPWEYALVRKN